MIHLSKEAENSASTITTHIAAPGPKNPGVFLF